MNEVFRIYYIGDAHTGETLSKRSSFEDAPGRLHYYLWLLNNDLGYFFNSPAPFVKAAAMLPIVAHFAGKSSRYTLSSLGTVPGKLLVLLALPASLLFTFGIGLCARRIRKSFE